jgi:N-acyl homoserine lactone hydrolase
MGGKYIVPLDLGGYTGEMSLSFFRKFVGKMEEGRWLAAYIGGAEKKIVVDAGPPDLERSMKYHPDFKWEPSKPEYTMEAQLAKAGVKPEEIELVVLTHLHWDHVGNVEKFPNARFICSAEELRCAFDPIPPLWRGYEALQWGVKPLFLKVMERLKTVEMKEQEIVEGVRLIPLPGHTTGSMGVVVETEKGPHVITGDAVSKYANLEGARKEGHPYFLTGIFTDMMAMWKSFERIDEIVRGDFTKVIPGHEPLVIKKERYP